MHVSLAGAVLFTMMAVSVSAPSLAADPSAGLAEIRSEHRSGSDMLQVEDRCLALIRECTTDEEKGPIYAEIPMLYLVKYGKGSAQRSETMPVDTAIKYCRKALACPLDVVTAGRMYQAWGAMEAGKAAPLSEGYPTARSAAASAYLKGLKFLVAKGVPETLPPQPSKIKPTDEAALKIWNEQRAALDAVLVPVMVRQQLTNAIVGLYTCPPYDNAELKTLVAETLGKCEAAEKLIAAVEARAKAE